MEGQDSQDPQGLPDHRDQTVSFSALKEQKGRWATLGLLASLGFADRKDGKVTLGTVSAQRVISSSRGSRGCQAPRAFPASVESQGRKGAKETPASTASLGFPGSRAPLATLDLPGPKG